MKLQSNPHQGTSVCTAAPAQVERHKSVTAKCRAPGSNAGVALVITLILLAVITFMTVTFLVVTNAERSNVATATDQTTARLAAEQAIEAGKDQIIIPMLSFTNPFTVGLMVSTNFIAPAGFSRNAQGYDKYTNVNYYDTAGVFLTGNDFLRNLGNQLYYPRPPVFVVTNTVTGGSDFRYYLDLNRNGRPEPNGWQYVTNAFGQRVVDASGAFVTNFMVGDPEWIGVQERGGFAPALLNLNPPIGFPYSANNRYLSRYAYIILPTSLGLDINHIHNYGQELSPSMLGADGFFRNQGVGPWEANLGAFLVDLNTNIWNPLSAQYRYVPTSFGNNRGVAFEDALSLLRYRYLGGWRFNLSGVEALFGGPNGPGSRAFSFDLVDGYTHGPLMTGFWLTNDFDPPQLKLGWAGADNPNRFFDPQEFFDRSKMGSAPVNFADRLRMASTNSESTYDRYTFYRLLSQIGTDSAPEPPKIHLNAVNVDSNGIIVPSLATNFRPWAPVQFFTNAALAILTNMLQGATNLIGDTNRWLAANTPDQPFYVADPRDAQFYNISNYLDVAGSIPKLKIQVYPTNFYSPAVHRAFQLAANIYDASGATNRGLLAAPVATNGFPSVFQPLFTVTNSPTGTNFTVYITGYREVTDASVAFTNTSLFWDASSLTGGRGSVIRAGDMLYGVPLVIGARKGFPNFNEFAMQTQIRVTRKLEFRRLRANGGAIYQTNQMYVLAISNRFGAEAWNSYRAAYPRNLEMVGVAEMMAVVTNGLGQVMTLVQNGVTLLTSNNVVRATPSAGAPPGIAIGVNNWLGFGERNQKNTRSFQIPFATTNTFAYLPRCKYSEQLRQFVSPEDSTFASPSGFPIPHWYVRLRTRFRFALVDTSATPPRIVDYANLESQEQPLDITELLERKDPDVPPNCVLYPNLVDGNQMWCTNKNSNDDRTPSWGVLNQIALGAGHSAPLAGNYEEYDQLPNHGAPGSEMCQINYFRKQFDLGAAGRIGNLLPCQSTYDSFSTTNIFYAPFVPRKDIYFYTRWQVNDPLVHYTVSDLTDYSVPRIEFNTTNNSSLVNIEARNERYQPWYSVSGTKDEAQPQNTLMDMTVKDPLITRSDDWNFLTNKFPNLGWLGRVHRGTPWQTVYFKAPQVYAVGTNSDTQRYWRTNAQRWMKWSGHVATNYYGLGTMNVDFFLTHPTNDYRLADLFTTAFSDNASRGQLPINQSGMAAWSAVLSGLVVNPTKSNNVIIQPAGSYDAANPSTWREMVRIWDAINRTRNSTVPVYNANGQVIGTNDVFPGKQFAHLGDILNVPELSIGQATYDKVKNYWVNASPFLEFGATAPNTTGLTPNQQNVLSDEVYERIPQQILSLLRSGEQPRFVIYAFGQTLRPAEHSVVAGGSFPGMITNYQITAESALRAVVRVDGAPKNPHVVIEDFSVLPPYQ